MRRFHLSEDLAGDLDALIDTRLLVQANSGGGKSWCIRRLLEQTHGRVQHLVIDPEGEFATLREKFDYVLAAKNGGDTAADPRGARLLAERLLELGVSAILDIYELKAHDRVRFVRQFLEALVDAPKRLWHPAVVVVDEAHVYCPQQGEAESAGAVIDLATRGRKRGFCAVLASQRLSKLHKDAAAECNNKLIGRTGLDVDVRRASDELGFGKERWRELRELGAGDFFAFGPAISREVVTIHVGPVETTHPKAGSSRSFTPPPATEKVKALLPQLADLPAEAEQRQRTTEELKKRIHELERELRQRPKEEVEKVKIERVEVSVLGKEGRELLEGLGGGLRVGAEGLRESVKDIGHAVQKLEEFLVHTRSLLASSAPHAVGIRPTKPPAALPLPRAREEAPRAQRSGNGKELPQTQQRILDTVAMLNERGIEVTRQALARWIGIHPNGGRYLQDLARLREEGYLTNLALTEWGHASTQELPTGPGAALEAAGQKDPGRRTVLAAILGARAPLTRQELAAELGIHPNGGRFLQNLARLREMGVIPDKGGIRPTEGVFR